MYFKLDVSPKSEIRNEMLYSVILSLPFVQPNSVKWPLSKRLITLYAGQKYCRMLQQEHSAILSTFIELLSLRPLFCLFFNGLLTQVLPYTGHPLTGTLTNSEDSDEMQHNAAFHQDLHCLLRLKQPAGKEKKQHQNSKKLYL